jgi:hypothetical protein
MSARRPLLPWPKRFANQLANGPADHRSKRQSVMQHEPEESDVLTYCRRRVARVFFDALGNERIERQHVEWRDEFGLIPWIGNEGTFRSR